MYARKSNAQKVLEDKDRSVTRQLENARTFAVEQGWKVVAEYKDDGVSGALVKVSSGQLGKGSHHVGHQHHTSSRLTGTARRPDRRTHHRPAPR